jgi:hypothetical protein
VVDAEARFRNGRPALTLCVPFTDTLCRNKLRDRYLRGLRGPNADAQPYPSFLCPSQLGEVEYDQSSPGAFVEIGHEVQSFARVDAVRAPV